METYSFEVVIGFRVEADNKHDALKGALDTESSLNEASIQTLSGNATVVRSIAPALQHFKPFDGSIPERPAVRTRAVEFGHRNMMLDPLKFNWQVTLRWQDGREYTYTVTEPTESAAIERARITCYHKTSHLGAGLTLVSVQQEN